VSAPEHGLRVLHLVWGLAPGGAERQVVTLAKDQAADHRVRVCCLCESGPLAAELEQSNVPVTVLGKGRGPDLRALLRLARLLREQEIDLLHAHIWDANAYGRLAAVLARTPVRVIHRHSTFGLERWTRRAVDAMLAPFTDAAVCVSAQIARRSERACGLGPDQVVLIRNGIELDRLAWARQRREQGPLPTPPRVLAVGALEPRKDHATFVRAANVLLQAGVQARFLIAGDGPLRDELADLVRSLGHEEAIELLGARGDVDRLLAEATVYVSSSRTEGVSLALLEAMAVGVPVVATAVGGTVEVAAEGRRLVLVPAGDAQALAEGIRAYLDCTGVGPVLAERARTEVARRFDARTMTHRVQGLYRDLAARARVPARERVARLPRRAARWLATRRHLVRAPSLTRGLPANTLRVLTYHRVRDGAVHDRLSVSTAQLARHLFLLHRHHIPVFSLAQACERLASGDLQPGAVALTFDDGYAELLTEAAPVLREFGAVATLCLPTALVDTGGTIDRYRGEPDAGRLLTWDEALELRDQGWELAGHGRTHIDLVAADQATLEREVVGSRADLADRLGEAPASFAYPFGRLSREVLAAVREAGYDHAVTVWPGANDAHTPRLVLRRTEVSGEDTVADLACKLRGGFDPLHRRMQRGTTMDPEGVA